MNNVYFAKEGLTSTSANFMANVAKELTNAATERLNSVKFFQTSVAVIGSNEKQQMSVGTDDISWIKDDLEWVSSMNAFCAWVREAIKEKETQTKNVNFKDFDEWAKENGMEVPKYPEVPSRSESASEQTVINSWDINKRNKYLRLEAFAATYGKYIHPEGAYSKARKKAHSALNNPITKEGNGRDTVLYYTEPSIDIAVVDAMFITLQDEYRSYEKELNQMKAEIKETVNKLNIEIEQQYQISLDAHRAATREYNSQYEAIHSKFLAWKTSEQERISNLKITIPDVLKPVFETLKNVGKTSK